jgi:hypothetical protein
MTLSWRTRRRLALLVLLVGLPAYIVLAVTIVGWFDRPGVAVELGLYVLLGILWALPFRVVFKGIGREAPGDNPPRDGGAR